MRVWAGPGCAPIATFQLREPSISVSSLVFLPLQGSSTAASISHPQDVAEVRLFHSLTAAHPQTRARLLFSRAAWAIRCIAMVRGSCYGRAGLLSRLDS